MASPYLTAPIADALCAAAPPLPRKRILTSLDAGSVQWGSLDPEALIALSGVGFEVRSIANLHAKVALIDLDWGLVGSGNLTGAGLGGGNYEMGVVLAHGQLLVAAEIFEAWWREAVPVTATMLAEYAALPKLPKHPLGSVGPALPPPDMAGLEEILAEDSAVAASRRYWINTNYHSPRDPYWWRRHWVSDGSQKQYVENDLLVIYLGKQNGGPQRCPAILRVTGPCRYGPDFVRAERDGKAAERWPYVTPVSTLAQVPPALGAPLEAAGLTYHSIQRGCEIDRAQFEALAASLRI